MTVRGHVENGVIVVDSPTPLPEGAVVEIEIKIATEQRAEPQNNPFGLLKGTGPEITEEDIAEMRREMWRNFPRDDF